MWLSAITRTYSQGLYTSQNTTQMLVVIFWIMTQIQIPWDNLKAFGRHAAVKTLASQWEAPVCISCCHCITVARIVVYCGQIYYGWTGIHSEVISLRIINQSRKNNATFLSNFSQSNFSLFPTQHYHHNCLWYFMVLFCHSWTHTEWTAVALEDLYFFNIIHYCYLFIGIVLF